MTSEVDSLDHQRSTLLAERDRVLNALQELDFDHAMGKIPEDEYPVQRALLVQSGAQVLRQLDTLQEGAAGDDVDARLEAAIEARRADADREDIYSSDTASIDAPAQSGGSILNEVESSTAFDPDDKLEVLLANRRRERQEKSAGFCPQCGGPLRQSDRFCPKCGASLLSVGLAEE